MRCALPVLLDIGQRAFMSSERVKDKNSIPAPACFLLEQALYEIATGALPFHGEPSGLIFKAILDSEPPSTTLSCMDSKQTFKTLEHQRKNEGCQKCQFCLRP